MTGIDTEPRLNGWCARGSHNACPDQTHGGLAGLLSSFPINTRPCSCNCHRTQLEFLNQPEERTS